MRLVLAAVMVALCAAPAAAQRYTAKQNGDVVDLADATAQMNVSVIWSMSDAWRVQVKGKDLVRTSGVNDPCVTEVEFEHEGHLYLVRRTISGANHTVKAEAHWIRGWALMFGQDNPDGFSGDTWLLALKTTLSF